MEKKLLLEVLVGLKGPHRHRGIYPGIQPHTFFRGDRRQRSGLVQSGMASSSRENASGLMLVSPSVPVGAF